MASRIILVQFDGDYGDLFWKHSVGSTRDRVDVLVPETHYAVVIKDGKYLETHSGGRFTVSEKNRKEEVSVDIVYMSKTVKLKILWGTKSRFVFVEPDTDAQIALGASGEYELQISSPKHFYLELAGTEERYDSIKLRDRIQSKILAIIENEISSMINSCKCDIKTIPAQKQRISESLQTRLSRIFELDYGLRLCSFLVSSIVTSGVGESKKKKPQFCSKCGVAVKENDYYCFNCGIALTDGKSPYSSDVYFCPCCGRGGKN